MRRLLVAGALAALVLSLLRPSAGTRAGPRIAWLALVCGAAAAVGLASGGARLAAIDGGALRLEIGRRVVVRGYVAAIPDRVAGKVRVEVQAEGGRLLVEAHEPVPELPVGSSVEARGAPRELDDWEAPRLERVGAATVIAARSLERLPVPGRGGFAGQLDGLRGRAEAALGRGTSEGAASLLRGFVLGQDDRIEAATVEQFKRSGLAHLLAVSGQNIVLLAVLATAVLAVLGVPLRARLAWILVAIAVYVPVAGAGPSIQRAGVMGAAGVVAALSGRPASRWYALLLAAAATLALDPRATGDVGWQLSFAAVAGILIASAPIAVTLAGGVGGWRRALADGVALTIAATLATAPLMAHHFGAVSVVALPANVIALPAVAPVMWLGMLAATVGQLEWVPVEPLTWLAGVLAAYIAQVAAWFGDPGWAQVDLELPAPWPLAAGYAVLASGLALGLRWSARRRALGPGVGRADRARRTARRPRPAALAIAAVVAIVVLAAGRPGAGEHDPPSGLRITILDVGQGEAILLEPRGRDPILVDAGSVAADVAGQLERRGVERLSALAITHPQEDHDGGAPAVLDRLETRRLLFARVSPQTLAAARAEATTPVRLTAGDVLRSGALRLSVLWPPAERLRPGPAGRPDDPNLLSLVLRAEWRGFVALLTGDAEAEAALVDPGRVDVLKLAHHGSEDAGLARLLELADPDLALISVGADNPFGHPSPTPLQTLAAHGVEVLRTDRDGEITIEVGRGAWSVSG